MAEGEPKVTAVDVLDGNGHLAEVKREVSLCTSTSIISLYQLCSAGETLYSGTRFYTAVPGTLAT